MENNLYNKPYSGEIKPSGVTYKVDPDTAYMYVYASGLANWGRLIDSKKYTTPKWVNDVDMGWIYLTPVRILIGEGLFVYYCVYETMKEAAIRKGLQDEGATYGGPSTNPPRKLTLDDKGRPFRYAEVDFPLVHLYGWMSNGEHITS
jgi:hypothetical protein